jgi:Ca-activated chloride channel homolog
MTRNLYTGSGRFAFLLCLLLPLAALAQEDKKEIRSGTTRYEQGKYADAELDFRKALEKSSQSYAGSYNLGNSLYKQDKQDEAAARYAEAAEKATDPAEKARAYHNLGNAQVKAQKYQEAVNAYKQSLRLNPADNDTRYNLAYAQSMLKKQQDQQKKDQQGKDQEPKDPKDQQNKDQKNEENKEHDSKQDQQQNQNEKQKDQQGKDGQSKPQPKISKEDAERILQALKNNEQELNKKLSRKEGVRVNVEKNW